MTAAHRCPGCGFESDSLREVTCPQCGTGFRRSSSFSPWLAALAPAALFTVVMFAFHFPWPMILFSGLASFFFAALGLRARSSAAASRSPSPGPLSPPSPGAILLDLSIGLLGLAFVCCVLFGFVTFSNAYLAVERVQGQPYHATTFQVIRPYYQKSQGVHGPDIAVYASGTVEGRKEWMDLIPYLKRAPLGQQELNGLVPPGTTIPVYLFPNLTGRSRIQTIDVLPPGEASRRTEKTVLTRVPVALAVLGAMIFLLVRIRRTRAPRAAWASSEGLG